MALHTFLFGLSGAGPRSSGLASLLERSSAHNFRYRLRVDKPELGGESNKAALPYIFRSFEANKQRLFVQEYSVGQTTLEQIFNQFAGSQENPEVAALTPLEAVATAEIDSPSTVRI